MNEFELYGMLCKAETVAAQYPAGEDIHQKIVYAKQMFSTRRYRFAAVGEFKRGKSSLINALVGSNLLPTNVLPTTAVINRIIYGKEKCIVIHYKNGKKEKRTIRELEDYATKLDKEKEEQASLIREITVEYPSVFCQNRIEIIDTPGLNDNEQMSEVTLGILNEIDSALVVVSALFPFSMTERELVITLLEQQGVRHIAFVVTFIDEVSNRKEDQDRVIEYIRKTISGKVYDYIRERFREKPESLQKAKKVLENPTVFAVSSVLALKGFEYDDQEMVSKSRFPEFKQKFFDLLIANQTSDMYAEAFCCVQAVADGLEDWELQLTRQLEKEYEEVQGKNYLCKKYCAESAQWLQQKMIELELKLQDRGFTSDEGIGKDLHRQLQQKLVKIFIKGFGSIRGSELSEQILQSERVRASEEASAEMERVGANYKSWICGEMEPIVEEYAKWRLSCGMSGNAFQEKMKNCETEHPFPRFSWCKDRLPKGSRLTEIDIILVEEQRIEDALLQFGERIRDYLAAWRSTLFSQNMQDRAEIESSHEEWNGILRSAEEKRNLRKNKYEENRKIVAECQTVLDVFRETGGI